MDYDVNDLMLEARVALDMNNVSLPLLNEGDVDTLSIEELIKSKIAPAARIVETAVPRHLLDSGKAFGGTIGWRGTVGVGSGVIQLPDDFMRLIVFQMSDWDRPVVDAADEGSEVAAMQRSRYSGIRGTTHKPVAIITPRPTGLTLEFFSSKGGASVTLTRARYLPIPKIGASGGINLCPKLKDAIVHYCAYLTALAIGATEQAAGLKSTAEELMI